MEVLQDTYKDTKIGRIPKDWELKMLVDIASFRRGSFPQPYGLAKWYDDENGHPFIQVYDVGKQMKLKPTTKRKISDAAAEKSVFVVKGTLILTIQGSIGRVAITQYDAYIDRTLLIFQSFLLPTDKIFLSSQLEVLFNKERQKANGSTILTITKAQLSKFLIPFPPLPEQQKIAAILSTIDEQISITAKIIEKSKELKKGLMQKLFSEGIGHTEFKDTKIGRIPKDWKVMKIGELINQKLILGHLDGNHGELYPKADEFSNEGVPYVSANALVGGKVEFKKCKRLPIERALKFKKGIALNGDIIFAHNATVGPCAMLESDLDFVILSTSTTYFRLDKSKIIPKYWYQFILSALFVKQYQRVMGQTTRNQVPIGQQRKFYGIIPSIPEQQKIVDILSEADAKIEKEQTQKAQLEALKKGLMQQLLTGKKRVKV